MTSGALSRPWLRIGCPCLRRRRANWTKNISTFIPTAVVRPPWYRRPTVGIDVEIVRSKMPAANADNGTRCPIASSAAHRVSLSALTAGKLVNVTSILIPRVIGRHNGTRCPIASSAAHRVSLSALTAGKLVNATSILIPRVIGRHNGTRCPIASLAAHRVSLSALTAGKHDFDTDTQGNRATCQREISWTSMPTTTADDGIQSPIAFLDPQIMPSSALTAGKLVKTISTSIPAVLRWHGGVSPNYC